MEYVELHARSAFSFLRGAATPEELIAVCAELKMPAMALLDNDGLYGAARFHLAAKKVGIKAHIGAEIAVSSLESQVSSSKSEPRKQTPEFQISNSRSEIPNSIFTLPLLVRNRTGYQNLCRLITLMKLRVPKHAKPGECAVTPDELAEYAEGLVCLTGDNDGPIAKTLNYRGQREAERTTEQLIEIFGRENVYAELQRHFNRAEEARNHAVIEIARQLKLPLLATNGVSYATRAQRQVADVFTCIRNHVRLETAGRLLSINSETFVKSPKEMAQLFADLPEAIANTVELSSRLEFTLKDLGYEFPRYPVPPGETMTSFLRQRTYEGAHRRYGRNPDISGRAEKQLEHELKLIEKLELEGYFLIVWDIVEFCKRNGILIQGRGSAANSAVCYSLGITAVDPVGMELLFERFLSEERGEWPDIDLDLPSGDQRERAIQYVYERYGRLGAAMTANVITYRGRSAAREVGKVLGFDDETLGRLSGLVHTWEWKDPKDTTARQFRDAGLDLHDRRIRKFFQLYTAVQDLPRHLGQHSGGMVICQGQLNSVVPLEPAAMPGRVVVQWDKEDCADLGIIKVDLLGLGMMAVLEETIQIISDDYREEVDLANLPPDDEAVYAALQQADTIGMFQIESRAQMSCLPRLRPQKFYDIVVQVAIIRPGPIVGNMVNPYLERRLGRAPVKYAHPDLEPVLKRTLGVPLFQEQLLKMAMTCAGFSGGEAEELRRAMGFKRSEQRMKDIEVKLRRGMTQKRITDRTQDEIVEQIASFALYGFPESHAASFALIAYASAYLKCHYLGAFTAATLNNQPMGFYQPFTIIKDAQRHGLKVLPVDVTRSNWECTMESVSGQMDRSQESGVRSQKSSGQRSEIRDQNIAAPDQEFELAGRMPSQSRRDEIFIEGSNDKFLAAPSGAEEEFRSFGAPESFVNPDSINIQPLYGCSTDTRHPALRLGLLCVKGLREEAGRALLRARSEKPFSSLDDLHHRVPELRKDELRKLAAVGALNFIQARPEGSKLNSHAREGVDQKIPNNIEARSAVIVRSFNECRTFGAQLAVEAPEPRPDGRGYYMSPLRGSHRRDALWQVERVSRDPGPLYEKLEEDRGSPLTPMTLNERLNADLRGTGITIGRHPMAHQRAWLETLNVTRAGDLKSLRNGVPVKVAGWVIVRQRPGTAKGFVFLSLEDETGIANIIVNPQIFETNRLALVEFPFLLIAGTLQHQDNVVSVKAKRIEPLQMKVESPGSHDFH
ncbi:MAG TPA: error-prone DNA polymerase [Pyrinomonadaceae bacterium]|nr:error-prone DNA polymerase [Pyrinomonadaceae bacterium]